MAPTPPPVAEFDEAGNLTPGSMAEIAVYIKELRRTIRDVSLCPEVEFYVEDSRP